MVRHLTRDANTDDVPPETDDRDAAALIPEAVADVPSPGRGWPGTDGRSWVTATSGHRTKALRRVTDHLIDHLAEIECRLAGLPTVPDRWHGRMLTLESDWARFTEADLDEATTLRQVVHHVADVRFYAAQVGRLAR